MVLYHRKGVWRDGSCLLASTQWVDGVVVVGGNDKMFNVVITLFAVGFECPQGVQTNYNY